MREYKKENGRKSGGHKHGGKGRQEGHGRRRAAKKKNGAKNVARMVERNERLRSMLAEVAAKVPAPPVAFPTPRAFTLSSGFLEGAAAVKPFDEPEEAPPTERSPGAGRRDLVPFHAAVDVVEAVAALVTGEAVLLGEILATPPVRRNPADHLNNALTALVRHVVRGVSATPRDREPAKGLADRTLPPCRLAEANRVGEAAHDDQPFAPLRHSIEGDIEDGVLAVVSERVELPQEVPEACVER
jgi:hypothetical protein